MPLPVPTQPPLSNCDPSYPDVCIPPVSQVGDLDCKDVPYGRFRVLSPDPHHFDGPYDESVPGELTGLGVSGIRHIAAPQPFRPVSSRAAR